MRIGQSCTDDCADGWTSEKLADVDYGVPAYILGQLIRIPSEDRHLLFTVVNKQRSSRVGNSTMQFTTT